MIDYNTRAIEEDRATPASEPSASLAAYSMGRNLYGTALIPSLHAVALNALNPSWSGPASSETP